MTPWRVLCPLGYFTQRLWGSVGPDKDGCAQFARNVCGIETSLVSDKTRNELLERKSDLESTFEHYFVFGYDGTMKTTNQKSVWYFIAHDQKK